MRCLAALVLLPLLQDSVSLKPKFQKFDKLSVSCTIKTEIEASNGRNSKYEMKISYTSEVEKADGDTAVFDCGVRSLSIEGTFKGRPVDYQWSRSGGGRGKSVPSLERALKNKKGWKITLKGGKGFTIDDGALPVNDELPLFNPGVFLGFSVPVPYGPADLVNPWTVKGLQFTYFNGFGVDYRGSLILVDDKKIAKISGDLKFVKFEDEVPIAGAVNFRGKGSAMLEYDVAKGRPIKGATAIKAYSAQGGFKRDINQVIEFEVN